MAVLIDCHVAEGSLKVICKKKKCKYKKDKSKMPSPTTLASPTHPSMLPVSLNPVIFLPGFQPHTSPLQPFFGTLIDERSFLAGRIVCVLKCLKLINVTVVFLFQRLSCCCCALGAIFSPQTSEDLLLHQK